MLRINSLSELLDWGAWFDILSIYNVKINSCSGQNKQKNIQNFNNLANFIIEDIGTSRFNEIIESDEYKNLYEANKTVFELVELAKLDKIPASVVDKNNYFRFVKKTELQKKYFKNEVKEVKINYE